MALQFYNTLSRQKENFSPINKNEVRMYTCGPTVYNYPHIGNYRAYISADIIKRVLMYEDFKVRHIMNLTDVDDKTIRDSHKEGKTLGDFTEFYTKEFLKDIKFLNIIPPLRFTKATDNITEMVKLITELLAHGLAYKSEDGSTYFNIRKFKNYGKLSGVAIENQKENASGRIKKDEYEKDNIQDFALWKAWDPEDGNVFWETSLGKGRPGWHIECSAMSMAHLGAELDIHTGGVDLIFPHHENEIAQSEGATGKQFVKYWLHNEWVLVDNKKMSKSLKNFYTLRDIIDKGINPLAFRFWVLMASYRTKVNFNWDALLGTETALKRLQGLDLALGPELGEISESYRAKFKKRLEDDLDTPRDLSLLWDLVKDESKSNSDKKATILDFDKVLGLGLENLKEDLSAQTGETPEEITRLAEKREEARRNKDFRLSDELRDKINSLGYEVKDTASGQKISKFS